ncbi:MAG: hypothetical protein EBR09_03835 [Proteobacteria bacterium]|nr:hypothetical protein [Pseudomonadota bacterium]
MIFMNLRYGINALAVIAIFCAGSEAFASGALQIVPYASVSSTKAIKPTQIGKKTSTTEATEESVAQRTTYGLRASLKLSRLFHLQIQGGTNKLDQTRKAVAMRDEYGDIDFSKDANVDPTAQDATYKYTEEQRVAQAKLSIQPRLGNILKLNIGAGVRARERFVNVTDNAAGTKKSIHDPIRYNATATAGFNARLLNAFTATVEYNFYFLKFPKTEPHEQEALIGFGFQL